MHRLALAVALASSAVLASCGGSKGSGPPERSPTGSAQVSALTQASGVTRIAVEVQPANVKQDLTFDAGAASFSGTLEVTAGSQTFTARAFRGAGATETLVGSDSQTVTIRAGVTAVVRFTILDASGAAPAPGHAPIITSATASNTHPVVGEAVTLSMSAVDPDGDPISYAWRLDAACAGSLSDPASATTSFTGTAPGACVVSGNANANGGGAFTSFVLLIASNTGAADVAGVFVQQPVIDRVSVLVGNSSMSATRSNATIFQALAPGATVTVTLSATIGAVADELTFSATDSCGGTTTPNGTGHSGPTWSASFSWTLSTTPGTCTLSLKATNHGLVDTFPLVALVKGGACPTDDAFEPNNEISSARDLVVSGGAKTIDVVRNDDDWFTILGGPYSALTVSSADASVPLEIYRTDNGNGTLTAAGSGTGSATAPAAPNTTFVVRILPAGACTSATTAITFTGSP
jgi:hypothetical protein